MAAPRRGRDGYVHGQPTSEDSESRLLQFLHIGPADGNPIGLGLLMVLGVVVLAVAGVVGLVVMLVETWVSRPGR